MYSAGPGLDVGEWLSWAGHQTIDGPGSAALLIASGGAESSRVQIEIERPAAADTKSRINYTSTT